MIHAAVVAAALSLAAPGDAPAPRSAVVAFHATGAAQARPTDRMAMFAALNAQRTAHGLAPLVLDARLCAVAADHARDMAARNYFGHVTPDGRTPWDRLDAAGVRYGYAGENLAQDDGPAAAEDALWRSSGHRANIMEEHYVRVGISAVATPDGEMFVQEFSD